ncbi:hypothetical protein DMUE_3720 [Dictyocoela muelleri]|nr:hypothetical protein DMUE_3720 [Dictyocoela muelleri]
MHNVVENIDSSMFCLPNRGNLLLYRECGTYSMVILCDIGFISKFSNARNFKVYIDGTFKSSPMKFYQLYIIHGEFNEQCIPIIHCFLYNKTKEVYEKLFYNIRNVLLECNVPFNPLIIQIDYE